MRIGLTGYGRAGKDTFLKPFIENNYSVSAMGKYIKNDLIEVFKKRGLETPWTEDNELKEKYRIFLEQWGILAEDSILAEMIENLEEYSVNGRLMKPQEAKLWKDNSGIVILIQRAGNKPKTVNESKFLTEMVNQHLIDGIIYNDSTFEIWEDFSYLFFDKFSKDELFRKELLLSTQEKPIFSISAFDFMYDNVYSGSKFTGD